MLKFGICTLEQLKQHMQNVDKEVSIHLYSQIERLPDAERLAERILLRFMDQPGAYKRTYRRRFEEFDQRVIATLQEHWPDHPWIIHDHGVSDGRTACDLFEALATMHMELQFFAFDFDPEVRILREGKTMAVINQRGTLLQIVWGPFVFNKMNRDSYRLYPLNHVIRFCLAEAAAARVIRKFEKREISATELLLFSPRALDLARSDPRFHLKKQNILEPLGVQEPATMVRAMNVLNPTHFTESQIQTALRHIRMSLIEGGLFVIGSNQEGGTIVDGAVYRKKGDAFELIWKTGNGAAIPV